MIVLFRSNLPCDERIGLGYHQSKFRFYMAEELCEEHQCCPGMLPKESWHATMAVVKNPECPSEVRTFQQLLAMILVEVVQGIQLQICLDDLKK